MLELESLGKLTVAAVDCALEVQMTRVWLLRALSIGN